MVMAILGGVLFFVGGCFIIATKQNMVAPENIAKFRIIGVCLIVSGIAIWAYLLITYGDPSSSSLQDVLTPLFIVGIIVSIIFAVYNFQQGEKTKGVISLVALALILVCLSLNSPSPDQTCWDCGRKFVSYEDSNGFCKSCNEYHKNIVNNLP